MQVSDAAFEPDIEEVREITVLDGVVVGWINYYCVEGPAWEGQLLGITTLNDSHGTPRCGTVPNCQLDPLHVGVPDPFTSTKGVRFDIVPYHRYCLSRKGATEELTGRRPARER